MTEKATLYGIGVGPGDPELVTLKARRLIEAAVVIAYPVARHGRSIARSIAAPYLRSDQIELAMIYPVTTEESDHPGGYEAALSQFYDQWAATLSTPPRCGSRRRGAVRGRSHVLRLLHLPARAARAALSDCRRAGRDVAERGERERRPAAGAPRRDLHRAAGDAPARRARHAAGDDRRRRRDEARADLREGARGGGAGRRRRPRRLRRAGELGARARGAARRGRPGRGALHVARARARGRAAALPAARAASTSSASVRRDPAG